MQRELNQCIARGCDAEATRMAHCFDPHCHMNWHNTRELIFCEFHDNEVAVALSRWIATDLGPELGNSPYTTTREAYHDLQELFCQTLSSVILQENQYQ